MIDKLIFYAVFGSQIFFLSYYFPGQIHARMKQIFVSYPPSDYPKLYPRASEDYVVIHHNFRLANRVILMLGIAILAAIVFWGRSSEVDISEAIPAAYGLLQMLPLFYLEFSKCSQFRLMRKANTSGQRIAEFTPRYVFDFVSPTLVTVALAAVVAAVMFDLYAHDMVIEWGHDTVERAVLLVATNIFFLAFGLYTLRGKKKNPHESHDDRARQISVGLYSMVYTSLALSAFVMLRAAGDLLDLDPFEAAILSVYFQVIVWASVGTRLRKIKLDRIDFEVYREDTSTA